MNTLNITVTYVATVRGGEGGEGSCKLLLLNISNSTGFQSMSYYIYV